MRARAAVLAKPGLENLAVREVEIDDPLPNEVLVRVEAAGICHSDLHFVDGTLPLTRPRILGHEVAGVVVETGAAVATVREGEHVVACFTMPCRSCARCIAGLENLCSRRAQQWRRPTGAPPRVTDSEHTEIDAGSGVGGLCDYVLVHEAGLVAIDPEVPFLSAALLGCAVVTGTGAVFHTARVGPGDKVVVAGCGGVGLSIIQAARIAGAADIVAIDRVPSKLAVARWLGATDTVDPAEHEDYVGVARELLDDGADHAFEAVGNVRLSEDLIALLAPRGTLTIVGIFGDEARISLPARALLTNELRVQGCYMGGTIFRRDIPKLVRLHRTGLLRLDEMIDPVLTLDEVVRGFRELSTGAALRPVVRFQH